MIKSKDELLQPLLTCYRSLMDCNLAEIANGSLLDFIYRVNSFGIELLKLDIRQESGRHRQAISAITEYLGLGNFETWTEQARQNFLLQELQSKRPLLPKHLNEPAGSLIEHPDVQEVFATMRTLAEQPANLWVPISSRWRNIQVMSWRFYCYKKKPALSRRYGWFPSLKP